MSDFVGYVAGSRVDARALERCKGARVVVNAGPCMIGVIEGNAHTLHVSDNSVHVGMMTSQLPGAHYARAAWDGGVLTLDVDDFEFRRLYYRVMPDSGGMLFGTRLDLVMQGDDSISEQAFVGQWCSIINMSTHSLIAQVQRVAPRRPVTFDGTNLRIATSAAPAVAACPTQALHHVLQQCASRSVVLGLSGGFDSRTLMAALHGAGVPFSVHTYGTPEMPDVRRALDVARADGTEAAFTDIRGLDSTVEDLLDSFTRTAWQSEGSYSGAHAVVFDGQHNPIGSTSILVDGGNGALLRGGLGNAILAKHRRALVRADVTRLAQLLQKRDATLLREDIRNNADAHLQETLRVVIQDMPQCTHRNARAWVDELFMRWNPRGYVASPQAVYDARLASTMPLLDASVAAAAMAKPARFRANGAWFRSMISAQRPGLRRLPFVGKHCDVPWFAAGRPTLSAAWRRLAPGYPAGVHAGIDTAVFQRISSALLDIAHSNVNAPWDVWDMNRVRQLAVETVHPSLGTASPVAMAELTEWLGYRLMSGNV